MKHTVEGKINRAVAPMEKFTGFKSAAGNKIKVSDKAPELARNKKKFQNLNYQ